MKYDISVIIPCYNAEKSIINTLNSLEKQKFKNFQVMIIDDGSTDSSYDRIQEFQKTTSLHILLIRQENAGVSSARNMALSKSNTKYICFLDADDEYDPDFLNSLFEAIDKYKTDTAFVRYYTKEKNLKQNFNQKLNSEQIMNIYLHHRKEKINFWCFIYKNEIIKTNSLHFDINIRYGEDSLFLCQYIKHCKNGGCLVDKELYKYNINDVSAMHNTSYDMVQNIEASYKIAEYWKDIKCSGDMTKYLIARSMWSAAKTFAESNDDLFKKFIKEYPVKESMKYMKLMGDEKTIKVSSALYLLSPALFQITIKAYSELMKLTSKQ